MFNKLYANIKKFIKENYKYLIVLIIIILLFTIELPYSIYSPGGAINLNERVEVKNGYEEDGSFNMAYVSTIKGTIPFLLLSKIFPDWDIMKAEDITADNETMDELLKRERLYLQESIDCAIINAYLASGNEVNITSVVNNVAYIATEAQTNLKIGDTILKVNGQDVTTLEEVKAIITTLEPETKVNLTVKRDNKEKAAYAITYKSDDEIKIGIAFVMTYEYETDPEANIKSKSSEAGSSGGLMMSLAVYNKLVEEDITKGKKIVGTGTIDIEGNVGEIGGVKYKLIGAVKNDADIFICPKENYEEALSVAKDKDYDIKIISVSTFQEALDELNNLE